MQVRYYEIDVAVDMTVYYNLPQLIKAHLQQMLNPMVLNKREKKRYSFLFPIFAYSNACLKLSLLIRLTYNNVSPFLPESYGFLEGALGKQALQLPAYLQLPNL